MMKIVLIFKSFLLYQGTQRIWSLLGQNDNLSQQKTREAWKSVEKPTFSCKNEILIFWYFHFHMRCSSLWFWYIFPYMNSLAFVKAPLELPIYHIFKKVIQKIFFCVSKTYHKAILAPRWTHTPIPTYWWSSSTDPFFRITPGPNNNIGHKLFQILHNHK